MCEAVFNCFAEVHASFEIDTLKEGFEHIFVGTLWLTLRFTLRFTSLHLFPRRTFYRII